MGTSPTDLSAPSFDLSAGHPVLSFVNTLDDRFGAQGPTEKLADYNDLVRFAQQTALLSAEQARQLEQAVDPAAAKRVLRSARELRETLAHVLYRQVEGRVPGAGELRTLERYFKQAQRHRQLHWQPSAPHVQPALQWQWDRRAKAADLPVWMLAHSASRLLVSEALQQIRACEADSCRWLFLDTSKNHTRRWCNMKVCGNRAKARRFQERRAQ